MDENDFIAALRPLSGPGAFELMDDAAVLQPRQNAGVVVSSDTMVEGVHFPNNRRGGGFSERLLRTALSDLAAKAALPIGYVLNVSWPVGTDPHWFSGFIRGLSETQAAFGCYLIGGDTTSTSGPLVASVTVFGAMQSPTFLSRSGANIGDHIYVSGRLGLAAMGLKIVLGETVTLSAEDFAAAEEAYLRPVPRFDLVDILSRFATSACDISDGLIRDASHLANASGARFDLGASFVPDPDAGDDYEVLFTAPAREHKDVMAQARRDGVRLTHCGKVLPGEGVSVDGEPVQPSGYAHRF